MSRPARKKNHKLALVRSATTSAQYKFGLHNLPKDGRAKRIKPVTIAKVTVKEPAL